MKSNRYGILGFCIEVMRPIFRSVFLVIEKIYDMFFLPGAIRRTLEQNEKFGHDVQTNLPFLFAEYGGVLGPHAVRRPYPFDGVATRVVLPEFILSFSRSRGEFIVQIAPKHAPDETLELSKFLSIVDKPFEDRGFGSFADLRVALEPRMRLLQHVFSPEHYPEWRVFLPFATIQREIKRRLDSDH